MKYLNRARWVTDKYILLMLGVFPLFVGFEGYDNITASKFWFFAAATGLWLLAALAMLGAGLAAGERYALEIRAAHIALGAFLAISGVSAATSEYGGVCLVGAARYTGYLTDLLCAAAFFGVSWLAAPRRRYVWAMAVSAGVCCVISILQLFGLDPFWFYPEGTDYYDKFVAYNSAFLGTIGNTGLLAAYLCLAGPLALVYGALSRRRGDRWLFLPGGLCLAVLAACDVDAGIVALAGCVALSAPVVIQKDRAARLAGYAAGGTVLAGLGTLWFWPGKSGTLYEMSQALHGHLGDEFGSHRGQIWKRCWELFQEHPWLGAGPGTAPKRILLRWTSEVRQQTVQEDNSHNVYLGHLIDVGLLGALAYVTALGCSLVTWVRRRKQGPAYPALGSALVCYLIQDFFGMGLVLTAPMMWVIWGLLESSFHGDEE